jgi:PAS domain S-box-containing protein
MADSDNTQQDQRQTAKRVESGEEKLRESEEMFRLFLEHAPARVAMFDREMRYVAVSRRWVQDFKLRGEVIGRSHYEVFPEIPERWREVHCRCLAGAVEKSDEDRFDRADGSVVWVKWEVRPWFDTAGEIGGILIFSEDITERKRTEVALRQNAAQLELVTNAAPVSIAHCDAQGRYKFVNRSYAERFGLKPTDCVGKRIPEVLGAEAYDAVQEIVESALSGQSGDFEVEIPYRDIGKRFIHGAYVPEFGVCGDVVGFVVAITDISERRRIEEALRDSEWQLRTLADTVPQLVWISEADGNVFWYNQRWYDYTGTTAEEMTGWGWQSVPDPQILPKVLEQWRSSLETGKPFEMELPLRGAAGLFRWFLTRVNPLLDSQGRIVRWFGTCTDIEESRRARQVAEESSRLKDEFLATVSHELRTPLTAIVGWTSLLEGKQLDEETASRAIQIVDRNARSLTELIENLLEVTRGQTGKIRLNLRTIELASVIQAAVDAVLPAVQAKQIRLQTVLDPKAGPVTGDPERLQQIVWNLLTNSIKFTPEGGHVQVTLRRMRSHVEITVSDTGRGISPEFLPFVFDRFRQADASSTRAHGGLGLGLSIVRHLTELHGGTVSAYSPGEEQGSTFVVRLPLTSRQAEVGRTVR